MPDLDSLLHKVEQTIEKVLVAINNIFNNESKGSIDTIEEVNTNSWGFKLHSLLISKEQKMNYLTMLQVKLEQGLEVDRALTVVEEQVGKFYPTSKRNLQKMYRNIRIAWQSDSQDPTLANTMRPYLSDVDIMILESAPSNIAGLKMIQANAKKAASNNQTIMMAALAPLGYFGAILAMVNFMHEKVVMASIRIVWNAGQTLRGSLKALYEINEFILNYQILIVPVVLGVFVGYAVTMPTFIGRWRTVVESIPVIGLPYKAYRANSSVAFLQTLSTLIVSGMPMERVLSVIIERANPFLKYEVRQIKDTFDLTGRISESLKTKLFDNNTLFLLAIYLEAKDPSKHIQSISNEIQTHQGKVMKFLAMIINVGGLTLVAAYLGLFASGTVSVTDYLTK